MPEGYEYLLGMKNEMSSPAHAATRSLDELSGALRRSGLAAEHHATAHVRASAGIHEHGMSIRAFATSITGSGGAVEAIEALSGALGPLAVAATVFEIGKFATEASEFKENAVAAYSIVRGTAEEGERTFQQLDKTAREIHMPAEKAHELAQRLMLEGLKSQEALTDTIRAVGDLQRVGLSAGAEKLERIISQSLAAGHLQFKGPRALAGTGLSLDALAAELGMSRQRFDAELKAGKIDAEKGIEAITHAVTTGKVGVLATKKFTITDAFTDMKNSIRGLFQEANAGPITDALRQMSEGFKEGSEGAKEVKEALDSMLALGGGIIDLAHSIGSILVDAINLAKKAFLGLKDAGASVIDTVEGAIKKMAAPFQSKEDQRWEKQAQADIDKRIDREIRTQIERKKLDAIGDFTKEEHTAAETRAFGKKINVDLYRADKEEMGGKGAITDEKQMREALKHATGAVSIGQLSPAESFKMSGRDAGEAFGKASLDAARETHKSHSPSDEFANLGMDAASGFAAGASSGSKAANQPLGETGERAGRSVSVNVDMGGIHVFGSMDANELLSLLESQMADVFERTALELGQ